MVRITLDDELRCKLNGLNEPIEVCDEAGHMVGQFLPIAAYEGLRLAAMAAKTPYSVEELKRRLAEKEQGGLPLAEIWRRLGRT